MTIDSTLYHRKVKRYESRKGTVAAYIKKNFKNLEW